MYVHFFRRVGEGGGEESAERERESTMTACMIYSCYVNRNDIKAVVAA